MLVDFLLLVILLELNPNIEEKVLPMSLLLACCLVITAVAGAAHAQVNCLVNTSSGIIDLSQIPQKSLVMTMRYQGQSGDHVFKFNLCTASSEPPQGVENCDKKSYVGEWGTNGGCEAQFDGIMQQPASRRPPNSCKVGPFDLSPIPSKAFPVEVAEVNVSSTLHVVQLSLCTPTEQPPRGADSCGVAAYYGEWSNMGACEAQFDAVASPSEFNGTHVILYFGNQKSFQLRSTVTDLDVIGVTRDSRGDLFTTATSKYTCAKTCTVQTPRGIVDLSVIPETVLPMWETADGRRVASTYRSICANSPSLLRAAVSSAGSRTLGGVRLQEIAFPSGSLTKCTSSRTTAILRSHTQPLSMTTH